MIYRIKARSEYSESELNEVYSALNIEQKRYLDTMPSDRKIQSIAARKLLGDVLGFDVITHIALDENGRPKKLPDGNYFSFSHSGKYVAVAVNKNVVGIDIQQHKKISSKLINRVCTQDETDYIEKTGEKSFFKLWTAKEAYVKCFGVSFADAKKISFVKDNELVTNIFGHRIVYYSDEEYSYTVIF